MKAETPKYNFKSYESFFTQETTQPNQNLITDESINRLATESSHKTPIRIKSVNQSKSSISNYSIDSLYNKTYNQNAKKFESMVSSIKHSTTYQQSDYITKREQKDTLEARVKTLSSFINLNRIETSNMATLSKGKLKEQEILNYKSDLVKKDGYYLMNKKPFVQDEVQQMKTYLEMNKNETKVINNNILALQRELMKLNDDIRKFNKLNSDQLASKDNTQNTVDMLKKHNGRLKELIKNQVNKTGELVHSVKMLEKKMRNEVNGITSSRKVHTKTLY